MMIMKKLNFKYTKNQKGSVVMLAIIMLGVLSLLTLSAYVSNLTEERGSYNIKDRTVALQAAEAALRDAGDYITSTVLAEDGFTLDCSADALCLPDLSKKPLWERLEDSKNTGWMDGEDVAPTVSYGSQTGKAELEGLSVLKEGVSRQPRYFIEVLVQPNVESQKTLQYGEQLATQYLYRVTAIGFGLNPATRVKLQAVFLK